MRLLGCDEMQGFLFGRPIEPQGSAVVENEVRRRLA
jgi:EAL domain-containing protein (putative c-di-GMP-specific phosphodiesterase class I)